MAGDSVAPVRTQARRIDGQTVPVEISAEIADVEAALAPEHIELERFIESWYLPGTQAGLILGLSGSNAGIPVIGYDRPISLDGVLSIGFNQAESHHIVAIEECPIASPVIVGCRVLSTSCWPLRRLRTR